VFKIARLTLGEKRRLVYGYTNFDNIIKNIEKEREVEKSEKLIEARKKHGKRRS